MATKHIQDGANKMKKIEELIENIRNTRKEFDIVLDLLNRMIEYVNKDEEIPHGFGLSLKEAEIVWDYCMRLLSIQYPGRNIDNKEIYQIVWGLDE